MRFKRHHDTQQTRGELHMKTLEQLQQEHSEMCATAADLGLTLPPELTIDFDVSTVGERVTKEIDKLIKAFRAGLDSDSGGVEETPPKPLATPRKKAQKAPAKKAASKKPKSSVVADEKPPTTEEGESEVAKPAKKAVAKKAAKKSAKKAVKKVATKTDGEAKAPRSKFPSDAIVTWIAKDGNPCREGTARWERYEKLRKATGKSVEKVLAAGVPSATLINASAAKVIKIA
jgi:hypothetical protein